MFTQLSANNVNPCCVQKRALFLRRFNTFEINAGAIDQSLYQADMKYNTVKRYAHFTIKD